MKILVVDDSIAMRLMVVRCLRQAGFGGHDIVQAEDGAKGYDAIGEERPDVVLSDWNMPNMTGIELLEKLKEESEEHGDKGLGLTFGFVTTEASAEMRARASEAGAKFLIAKPFTPDSFKDALTDIIA
ncbi:MAG: response regulator [Pseudomonadota bacterium]